MTELIVIITESRKNIDKTKVCSRHRDHSQSLFFSSPSPATFFLCDTTSHHRLITSTQRKLTETYKYMLMYSTDLTSAHPETIRFAGNNKLHDRHISIVTSRKTVQDRYSRGLRERERERERQRKEWSGRHKRVPK